MIGFKNQLPVPDEKVTVNAEFFGGKIHSSDFMSVLRNRQQYSIPFPRFENVRFLKKAEVPALIFSEPSKGYSGDGTEIVRCVDVNSVHDHRELLLSLRRPRRQQ